MVAAELDYIATGPVVELGYNLAAAVAAAVAVGAAVAAVLGCPVFRLK